MEQQTSTTGTHQTPATRVKEKKATPDPVIEIPPRGGEPKSIGQLLEPIQAIIKHPDKDRIMADFFNRFW